VGYVKKNVSYILPRFKKKKNLAQFPQASLRLEILQIVMKRESRFIYSGFSATSPSAASGTGK